MTWDFPSNLGYALIDDYPIDCLVSDTHDFESDVTEFPTESGSDIADNIRNKPLRVTMECLVSNTPIGTLDSQTSNSVIARSSGVFPADDAYKRMVVIRDAKALVTISTSLDVYENMAMESLSIPRTAGGGDYLHFTIKWVQVTTVENVRTVRVSTPIAQGNSTATKAPAATNTAYYIVAGEPWALWYDKDIQGWRSNATFGAKGTNPAKWYLSKGKPYGMTDGDWRVTGSKTGHPSDAYILGLNQQQSLPTPTTSLLGDYRASFIKSGRQVEGADAVVQPAGNY